MITKIVSRGLLNSTDPIDSVHIEAIRYNDSESWCYPTAE